MFLVRILCRRDATEFDSVGLALDVVDVNNQKTYTVAVCDPRDTWSAWLPPQVELPSIPGRGCGGSIGGVGLGGRIRAQIEVSVPKMLCPKRVFGLPKTVFFSSFFF